MGVSHLKVNPAVQDTYASLRGQRMTLFPFGIRVSFNVVRIQLNAKARPIREI